MEHRKKNTDVWEITIRGKFNLRNLFMNRISVFLMVAFIFLSACASKTGWEPTVDPHNDPHPDLIAAHMEECGNLQIKLRVER